MSLPAKNIFSSWDRSLPMSQRNGPTSAPIPVIKPTNQAIIDKSVILSSRENNLASSASCGRNWSASLHTTMALIAPSARAVKKFSFSIIDLPGAETGLLISVVIMRPSQSLHGYSARPHNRLDLQRELLSAYMHGVARIARHSEHQRPLFYLE